MRREETEINTTMRGIGLIGLGFWVFFMIVLGALFYVSESKAEAAGIKYEQN